MSLTKCGYCGTYHDTVREAIECCSEVFEDDDGDGAAPAVLADGGAEGIDRLAHAAERQADALEELAERQRVTNAALVELIRTVDARAAQEIGIEEAHSTRSGRSVAGWVEDAALNLAENVDLGAVDRARRDR